MTTDFPTVSKRLVGESWSDWAVNSGVAEAGPRPVGRRRRWRMTGPTDRPPASSQVAPLGGSHFFPPGRLNVAWVCTEPLDTSMVYRAGAAGAAGSARTGAAGAWPDVGWLGGRTRPAPRHAHRRKDPTGSYPAARRPGYPWDSATPIEYAFRCWRG